MKDRKYRIIKDEHFTGHISYWIRSTNTYISKHCGYAYYYMNFCKTIEEYEQFVIENFNAYKGKREAEDSRNEYSVYEGNYTKHFTIKIDEMKYKTERDAEEALRWMESAEIIDKLVNNNV